MGNTQSTVRILAPASFLFDFAAQQYGMFSSPNMLDIHNKNLAAFSPQPYFIGGFFFPQQLFQLAWLWKLWKQDGNPQERAMMNKFAWVYSLGNFCIGTWMFFWNSNDLVTSNVFVIINTVAQLLYISTQLEPLDTKSTPNWLTHVVAKTFAGIGVLDFLHNTSAAYFKGVPPSSLVQIATGVGFAAAASMSDWIFGGCLVYDLVALSCGQQGGWSRLLGAYAAGAAGIVGLKNWFYPRWKAQKQGAYSRLMEDGSDV
ncbi:hypothetical protein EK21DRAFT_101582 [Setomelanomma holmii]|uniref:Uncharacterized protein n=1 Tax=Setomelanomma holmii TaxID=210430 RepID=A0A9P4H861_9PLEO|nr:hypothetical protein EK21DRAFT_101582 [Setomelanomma holmii]